MCGFNENNNLKPHENGRQEKEKAKYLISKGAEFQFDKALIIMISSLHVNLYPKESLRNERRLIENRRWCYFNPDTISIHLQIEYSDQISHNTYTADLYDFILKAGCVYVIFTSLNETWMEVIDLRQELSEIISIDFEKNK